MAPGPGLVAGAVSFGLFWTRAEIWGEAKGPERDMAPGPGLVGLYPRPKKQSTGLFFAHCGGPACSSPHHGRTIKNPPWRGTPWGAFAGRDG